MSKPSLYRAFGLTFRSELALPELVPADPDAAFDVDIRLRAVDHYRPPSRTTYVYGDNHFLYWPAVGGYMIHGGEAIDIDPTPGVSEGLLRLPLLGPVMALLLHGRGALVLHASAILIGERVAVLVGDKGAGKSTTAAAALARGHHLYTDDILAIDFADGRSLHSSPGYPAIKLDPQVADALIADAVALPAPIADFPKQINRLQAGVDGARAKLGRIYVLTRGESAVISRLNAGEALKAVMRYAYVPLFQGKPWSREETHRLFTQSAALADVIGVARLETPSTVERLGEAIACIEADLRA